MASGIPYDLEERTEDAFAAYLKAKCSGELNVYPGFSAEALKVPAVTVQAMDSDQVGGGFGVFAKPRQLNVEIVIRTEAADLLDGVGVRTMTARERNSIVRGDVMAALSVADDATAPAGLSDLCEPEDMPRGLAAELTAVQIPGLWVMQAIVTKVVRSVEEQPRMAFVSTISLSVIAQPVAIGGEPT